MSCDLSSKIGHALLFIGNECRTWSLSDFVTAAKAARDLGFDGIVPKRADGTIKWYTSLQEEKQAVNGQGCGYIPFIYSYGPKFSTQQIINECALLAEIQRTCDGIVVCDMESEWNDKVDAAAYFAQCMKKHPQGTLIISTWGDPVQQQWTDIIRALEPVVAAWWPQQYSTWLGTQTGQFTNIGVSCIHPTVDLSQEAGPNDPLSITKGAVSRGCTTIGVWEYEYALKNPQLTKALTALMRVNPMPQQPQEKQPMGVPQGWHDNGTMLTAPNGHVVMRGFREYVLAHTWDPANMPLMEERPANPGTFIVFMETELGWTPEKGVYPVSMGNELMKCWGVIAALQSKLQQVQQGVPSALPTDVIAALKTIAAFATKV